jgi:hypothetical protein
MNESKWMVVPVASLAAVALAVAGLALAGGCCTTCSKVPVADVPSVAQKAIDQYAEGGLIRETEMKKKCGMVYYKVHVRKSDGSEIEIVVNAEGKLYKLEREDAKR